MKIRDVLLIAGFLFAADPSVASPIATDSFRTGADPGSGQYPPGDVTGPASPTLAGFSGNWTDGTTATGTIVVQSAGLTHPVNRDETGGTLAYNGAAPAGARRAYRALAAYSAPTPSTPTYYMSGLLSTAGIDDDGQVLGGFVGHADALSDGGFFSTADDHQIQGAAFGFAGQGAGTGKANLVLRTRIDTVPTSSGLVARFLNQTLVTDIAANTTYFVVVKIEKDVLPDVDGNDRVTVWVNPLSADSEALAGAPTATLTTFSLINDTGINKLTLTSLDYGSTASFDELRFGTSFSAVVPEPGCLGLAAVAAGLLARRRRR